MSATITPGADIAIVYANKELLIEEVLWADFEQKLFWEQTIGAEDSGLDEIAERDKGHVRQVSAPQAIEIMKRIGRQHVNCPDGKLASADYIERKLLDAVGLEVWP
jgi:hypothetical protein